jgi:DNA polymerase-3 subunit beta
VAASGDLPPHLIDEGRKSVSADGTTIAFNARYLADVLTNVAADQFALELNGPLSPGVFKPLGDDHYIHVVMPVRTTS